MGICPGYFSYIRKSDKLWISNLFFNGLLSYDLVNGSMKYEHRFQNVSREFDLHRKKIIDYGDNLYFVPTIGKEIICYDIKTKIESVISFPIVSDEIRILSVKRWDDKIAVVFTDLSQGLFILDLKTHLVSKQEKLSSLISKYRASWGHGDIIDMNDAMNAIQFIDWTIGKVIIVDLEREKLSELDIPSVPISGTFVLMWKNNKYWILSDESTKKFFCWDAGTGKIIEYIVSDELISNSDSNYIWNIFVFREQVYVLMRYGDVIEIDEKHGCEKRCFDPNGRFEISTKIYWYESAFAQLEFTDDEMWCHPCRADRIVIYNLKTGEIKTRQMSLMAAEIPDFGECVRYKIEQGFKKSIMVNEKNPWITLEEFCYGAGNISEDSCNIYKNIGKIIIQHI